MLSRLIRQLFQGFCDNLVLKRDFEKTATGRREPNEIRFGFEKGEKKVERELIVFSSELCVMCGKEIPEGRQVCAECEKALEEKAAEKRKSDLRPKKRKRGFLKSNI